MKLNTFLSATPSPQHVIGSDLAGNKELFFGIFNKCLDFACYDFHIGANKLPACVLFLKGMSDEDTINNDILKTLSAANGTEKMMSCKHEGIKGYLKNCTVNEQSAVQSITDEILQGHAALLLDNSTKCFIISSIGLETRQITEPVSEGVVKGPREGFTETIQTNVSLLRRKIKNAQLKIESNVLGTKTKTQVYVVYLEGTTSESILQEVKRRLGQIKIDGILESQYIEEYIEDETWTVFPQAQSSERPDKVAAAILEGRIAILVDGTPFVLIVPTVLAQLMQSSEDYYQRFTFSFFIRVLRYTVTMASFLLPSLYISVATYHQEMIPTALMISIVNSYENVPFPIFFEALLMEITFEALREAGIRLPRPIGQAVSIVGALVIGQAAVQAGLVSYGMVIVVSMTGIASFIIPSYNLTTSFILLKFVFMSLAGLLGLYGVMLGLLALLIHLASLRSFGIPYLAPIAPTRLEDMKDVAVRFPWWKLRGSR